MERQGIELARMHRVNVVGSSGSGRSTFARRLAAHLGQPYIELDAVFWEPNWTEPSDEALFSRLEAALAGERWVLDGNYDRTTPIKWPRTQTVIWLDYPLWLKLTRSVRRSLRRWVTQQELWPGTGNRESLSRLFSGESILRFAYRTHAPHRARYEKALRNPPFGHLRFVRLRSPKEAEQYLAEVRRAARKAQSNTDDERVTAL